MKAQEGHEGEVKAQDEQEEDVNSMHEETHVSNRHMTWWQNARWVRINSGPHLRTARDRRKVWLAATRAAQEVRETGKVAGREREEWEKGKTERREHCAAPATTATTTATTAATAAAARRFSTASVLVSSACYLTVVYWLTLPNFFEWPAALENS